jgi:hypothetical protein
MPGKTEIIQLADDNIANLNVWLNQAKLMYESVPYVQQAIKWNQEVKATFVDCPIQFKSDALGPIQNSMEQTKQYFGQYSGISAFDPFSASVTGSAFLSSASSSLSAQLSIEALNPEANVSSWATGHLANLGVIQTDELNKQFISKHLDLIRAGGSAEFEESVQTFYAIKNGIGTASAAGIAMRNVLETLNGNAKQLARRYMGITASQKIDWPTMACAIAKGAPSSAETVQMKAQELEYKYLKDEFLTKVAKNDRVPTDAEWDAGYTRYIGFLYTSLALIDFRGATSAILT